MAEYIIRWNIGFGYSYRLVTASCLFEADDMAYDACMDDAYHNADYEAIPATDELKEQFGF